MKTNVLELTWDTQSLSPPQPVGERVALYSMRKHLAYHIWNIAHLRQNPYTYPEVMTLLGGVKIGHHRLTDTDEILTLIDASNEAINLIQQGQFRLDKKTFLCLNNIITRSHLQQCGAFRDHRPNNEDIFTHGLAQVAALQPYQASLAIHLFGIYYRLFTTGNFRTSFVMMNGWLMQHGYEAISVPAAKATVYREIQTRFIESRDGTELMGFLAGCNEL